MTPTTDSGPLWSQMTDDELLSHYWDAVILLRVGWNRECQRVATRSEVIGARPVCAEILAHIGRRASQPGAGAELVGAWLRATT